MNLDQYYAYDFETYPDIFTAAFEHVTTGSKWFFEISTRRNDYHNFVFFISELQQCNAKLVGYNNIGFDYPILHMIVTQAVSDVNLIFQKAQAIITSFSSFDHQVWESDWLVDQVDLYKIHHFDNAARRTSLKTLEFNMLSWNLEDLPFKPAQPIGVEGFDTLGTYNKHDVSETKKFFMETVEALEMREQLTLKLGKNFTNHNDTKIGKDYFIMRLGEELCFYRDSENKKQPRQTIRANINLSECVFDYIQFKSKPFQLLNDFIKKQIIYQTKGAFDNLRIPYDLAVYSDPSLVKVRAISPAYVKDLINDDDHPLVRSVKKKMIAAVNAGRPVKLVDLLKHAPHLVTPDRSYFSDNLHVLDRGFRYDFGTGGIHGCCEPQIAQSDDTFMILDIDVKSYYPNLAIANRLSPEHLGDAFCSVYKDLYEQRKVTDSKSPENAMLKLALNGVYGDSNSIYSPFYDPKYTMTVTINGQLLLALLAERITDHPEIEMIQINTDGLTIRMPRDVEPFVKTICSDWERLTLLELEYVEFKRFFVRDVNNFIAEKTNGDLKRKGIFAHDRSNKRELPWHKNHGGLIIKKAAEAVLLHGVDPETFIRSHNNVFDFMKRAKVPRSSRLIGKMLNPKAPFLDKLEVPLSQTTRYYITEKLHGVELFKIMPPLPSNPNGERYFAIDKGFEAKPCNNMNDLTAPINYQYYIDQTNDLVRSVRGY
jgi:hypothetical protein